MSLDNPIYLIWLFVAVSAGLAFEAVYLLCFSSASYRSQINRRLMLSKDRADRESVLVELRRERGLSSGGNYRLNLVALNRLILQSGITLGFTRLAVIVGIGSVLAFGATMLLSGNALPAVAVALFCATALPLGVLHLLRSRRQKKFAAQFPDALDIIVRSLRAGHPVPVAVSMVGREMPDPIGSEFGIVSDEITYGADLETAMRSLYCRIGSDDLPLFVTAVAIQGSTGGNLGEILQNLSGVIRQRFKMRRKISRTRRRRPRLGDDPFGAADRHVFHHPMDGPRLLRFGLAISTHQAIGGRRRHLDGDRQPGHVQDGELQDLTRLSFPR